MVQRSIRVSRARSYQGKCLLDRGANGNICGGDVRSISFSDRTLNVTGIDEHKMRNLKIGTFGGVVSTQRGDVIAIFNQSAYHPGGKSILSCLQVEDNGITVHDKLIPHGGRQCIETPDGYVIPLDAHQGLVYMKIRPFTNEEFRRLNHVVLTRDIPWDPSRYDRSLSDDRTWLSQQVDPLPLHDGFDNGVTDAIIGKRSLNAVLELNQSSSLTCYGMVTQRGEEVLLSFLFHCTISR